MNSATQRFNLEAVARGRVVDQYVTCGRQNCHCATGGSKHGPYSYLRWTQDGRRRKYYLPAHRADEMRYTLAILRAIQGSPAEQRQWRATVATLSA